MIVFVSNKLIQSTVGVGDNIYAPSDDGVEEMPLELAKALNVEVVPAPTVETTPEATPKRK